MLALNELSYIKQFSTKSEQPTDLEQKYYEIIKANRGINSSNVYNLYTAQNRKDFVSKHPGMFIDLILWTKTHFGPIDPIRKVVTFFL